MEIYDKAKYHFEGEFPRDLSKYQAYVHTGLFFGWIMEHGLLSKEFSEDFADDIAAFRRREITGPRPYEITGGVLDESMLSVEGNRFARYYFDLEKGNFIRDYEILMSDRLPSFYSVADTWENYERLSRRIDQRFDEWLNNRDWVR